MTHCIHGHLDRSQLSRKKKNSRFRYKMFRDIKKASLINHSRFMSQRRNKRLRDGECENFKSRHTKRVLKQNIQEVTYFTLHKKLIFS